jgi:hypothetical protein
VIVAVGEHDRVAGADLAFMRHAQVKTRARALEEPLDHIVAAETHRQLLACMRGWVTTNSDEPICR